ncbi:calcium-binding protein [Leisingera daeponensis]|uniref:Calcium-binding protein n=1 Tax=Leisingera daeponensis TaxID=405746 RepID=A0ABS7NC31_9RHOB|nr:calcium-binding protein [Leisingera daeponensis]
MLWLIALGSALAVGALIVDSDDDDALEADTTDSTENTEGGGSEGTGVGGIFYGDGEDDIVNGNEGNDTSYGGFGNDLLNGLAGADGLDGEDGDDTLSGGAGNDVLQGGFGNDLLSGGIGNDFLQAESNDDTLSGGGGDDGLHGGNGADTLNGGSGNDLLNGASVDIPDQLLEEWLADFESSKEPNSIGGNSDAIVDDYIGDNLDGGAGNDTLIGSAFDTLTGGEGADEFVAGAWSTSGFAAVVTDFDTSEDMIVYRYDEAGADPELTSETISNADGTIDVRILADGLAVLHLQDVGTDFDLATHVSLVASPVAALPE